MGKKLLVCHIRYRQALISIGVLFQIPHCRNRNYRYAQCLYVYWPLVPVMVTLFCVETCSASVF